MKKIKRIIAMMVVLAVTVNLNVGYTFAQEETIDTPVLGLDPSSTIGSGGTFADIPNIQPYSGKKEFTQIENSKKGLQGIEWTSASDAGELGVKHTLLNIGITPFLIDGDVEYSYEGKVYKFNSNHTRQFERTVRSLNAAGVTVTAVLLAQDDHNLPNWDKLVYHPERGHNFYGLNTATQEARDTWAALFEFLTQRFGQPGNFIENWILGNEVNMPAHYNWTGTLDPAINAKVYADSFLLLYNALEKQNKAYPSRVRAKGYISLDRSWMDTNGMTGIGAKDFLDRFAKSINEIQAGVDWCVAFHPYAVAMDPTSNKYSGADKFLWGGNQYTPNSIDAKFVTAANLNVLTDYVRDTYGPQHRIILSEQGFDAKGGEDYQAASLAYTFYAGQFNDMVDSMMFRSWSDNAEEQGLRLGIKGRKAERVFKYMDTDFHAGVTGPSLRTIGVKIWNELVPNFSMPGMSYQDVAFDDWFVEAVKEMDQLGFMTGINPNHFGAAENLKRSHFATTLYRVEGNPEQAYTNPFGDVPDGHFYSLPVSWATQKNIVTGYEDRKTFGPNDDMTREQLATLMFRYAQHQGKDVSGRGDLGKFADAANVSNFATEAMKWSVAVGIIKGEGSTGGLNPQGLVNRAVCAAVIQRYIKI